MNKENIEAHLQTSDHIKQLSGIVESTIDTQLVLSKRMAKTENTLRITGISFCIVSVALAVLVLIQQYQITQL
jgi:hypothetical protein